MHRILLLGGTTEASLLARALATARCDAVFSYAGRTADPVAQPLPQRVGGFGGVPGLITYLRDHKITHVIDATHPFAAQMSQHAATACQTLALPLAAFERPPWQPQSGDMWNPVQTIEEAVKSLPAAPAIVFLAIGRQNLDLFTAAPQHRYLLRLVDAPTEPLLPHSTAVIGRGPFRFADDLALLQDHDIDIIVTKNSGGTGADAKLTAARTLGLPVIMVNRPAMPQRPSFATVAEVMHWLGHTADLGV
ncbi:MAG: cobalt-precorrin-6A reductase [Candidatus Saccharibacteria bacterium]|nr:cobalt-precorrin-6A reductase [Pseudorhodobacter sp.]